MPICLKFKLIKLVFVFCCLAGSLQAQPTLELQTTLRWKLDAPWFGGWSGIEITDHGQKMTVINDKGHIATAKLRRTDGKITGTAVETAKKMGRLAGGQLQKSASDAEGLAISDLGQAYVSFEHNHRIMHTSLKTGKTSGRIALPFQSILGANEGVEALAVNAHGTVFAIGEKRLPNNAPFPLYAYANKKWRISAHIPKRGPFVPVGADFDRKNRLWVLERAVTPLGFRSRVRLFEINPQAPQEYTVLSTFPGHFDNLEGISIWDDPNGQMHVTMISDDNFMRILRTQIVEYIVRE